MAPTRTARRLARRLSRPCLLAVAALLAPLLPGAPASAAAPAAVPVAAAGVGCGTSVGRVPLDTTYNPATGRYELNDPVRGNHKTYDMRQGTSGGTLVTDDDNVWCEGGRQADAVAAHYVHAVFWDYFLAAHGRKGPRGDGKAGCSRVHYGNRYLNAFYESTTGCMVYGDGAGTPVGPLTRIDVGVRGFTAGVVAAIGVPGYSGEAAGLNEATRDLFTASAEFRAANTTDPGDYLIGEFAGSTTAPRRMDHPSLDGHSPDSWSPGTGQLAPVYAAGPADHFFYLLSEGSGPKDIGGVHYDSPTYDGKPVTGIGREKAAAIWYRALTLYLTPTANYRAARAATVQAAVDLYGKGPEPLAVGAAWTAVNVG
ncbi:M4 family metallopeptidase [Streptomyces sp. NPDC001941]|uniref:M4 family metallopeptidase n=1 Tax=Streptomyces sp. NPDC001941 TaxID=3154659 RepID=UPI0033193FF5